MTYSELRASDAERERVVTFLREHALLGRLVGRRARGAHRARVRLGHRGRPRAADRRPSARLPPARPAPQPHAVATKRSGPPPALIAGGIGALILTGLPFALVGVVLAVGVALLAVVFALSVVFGPILLIALLIVLASKRRHAPRRRPTHFHASY